MKQVAEKKMKNLSQKNVDVGNVSEIVILDVIPQKYIDFRSYSTKIQ